jgi:hypothetical protein
MGDCGRREYYVRNLIDLGSHGCGQFWEVVAIHTTTSYSALDPLPCVRWRLASKEGTPPMDDSGSSDGDANSPSPTVASILGIKGSLRLRLHGSSQKAHVVLRRVELEDDSSDDGESKPVVYFSLFAQKRIEVKPGKEILVALGSADGRFKDRAVMFEGDLRGTDDSSDDEGTVDKPAKKDPRNVPVGHAMPPKMRRTWTKQLGDESVVTCRSHLYLSTLSTRTSYLYVLCSSTSYLPVKRYPPQITSRVNRGSSEYAISSATCFHWCSGKPTDP